ncbi:unnamed protein product [Caenorhabditis angaria]|uniref:ShKT domain-containing protein n=1 Tax=Caenorhabditis angaria TaxID=860376 RepID=A0A9P1IRS8_9PELO|nr:unnamed protein product [Caenorhabditis angaria]
MLRLLLFTTTSLVVTAYAGCEDADPKCSEWATAGECSSNAVWMMANCRKSCHSCQGGDTAWKLRTHIQSTYKNVTDNITRQVRVESVPNQQC